MTRLVCYTDKAPRGSVRGDGKIPPVYPKDGRPRRLGTDDTKGLMLYAAYADKEITLRVFHGVADLHGIYAFLKTLLKFYYSGLGAADIELPEPDSIDAAPLYEAVLQKGSAAPPSGIYNPSEHEIFHLPEENFVGRTTRQRVFEIDVPLEPLLTFAKESDSSVVPTLQAIVGHAIHKTYDVGEKDVVGYTPIDLRAVYQLKTGGNGASTFSIPYPAELEQYDLSELPHQVQQ